ncbi:ribosomal RNA small subunit methyltransferase G-like isoform X2 [Panicum virgatum]|uniref:ribosomal RNA small subunit methyltransferase G-like isoform X2 n=1 Tax=Panicum virgatum TaxID=38727 RepID=UPI0019D632BD|nr:ribosomal RNA small subunit methyltransferase G-like isoform X2 [Panicum virgatum]
MSLCCCSTAAGRGFLLPSILLSQRHLPRHPLLNLRTTAAVAPAAAAASISSLSAQQQRQVSVYVEALLDWNQRMNLTAVTDEAEVMTRHVEDSLAVLAPLERAYRARSTAGGRGTDGVSLIDVGSGAGLPGLILAVVRPSWRFTLLESMKKRCTFLEHATEAMGLSNVDVVCDRAENVGQSLDYREAYDIAAARAVAELKVLEYCLPLVRVGGLFIAAKGHDPHEEIKNAKSAVKKLGASMLELCNVESMGPHGQRTAVIYFKERATPRKYPRLPGTPSKMPL